MVEVLINDGKYQFLKTVGKVVREFAIWLIPQVAAYFFTQNPGLDSMTIGAAVSVLAKTLQDYLKHK